MRFFCVPLFACNRQVDSIDKRQCNLTHVPNDIERYSRTLEELLLDMNHIKDLPKSLFRLHKLRRLNLGDNDLSRLPNDIAGLQGLVELNISRNDISDIPEEIKECRQLLILDISSNPIARLPDSITLVRTLTHLALNDTSLTKLPQDIGRLIGLRSLEIRENHLRSLPSSITNLIHLQRLDLGQNELEELPAEIGALRSLVEFYIDENSLSVLPDSILFCRPLEQLDLASNRLIQMPDQLGDLEMLTDLTLSHNSLSELPNSIGRMKRLNILKVDDNALTRLTPAIGSCTALTEIFLMQNLLSEMPSTIGNLNHLSNLNFDRNQVESIPSLIGNCSSLTILSARDNQIEQLPLEIGKLSHLRVLDVCGNKLSYLPYTINVLYELQALWLSPNQSQAMLKLTQGTEPKTGIRVLTCYLLPQQSAHQQDSEASKAVARTGEFVGGPKVHFGDSQEPEEGLKVVGNFERKDTPHPKPGVHGQKLKKQHVDGHVIQHDERRPSVVSLTKKSSSTEIPDTTQKQVRNGPKSSLKHPPVHNTPAGADSSFSSYIPTTTPPPKANQTSLSASDLKSNSETKRLIIRRDSNVGLGLSIAGGIESTPFINNDTGLFVSKLTPGAPAERAGLRIGDKLLEVNGTSMVNQRHDVAVQCMQKNTSAVELVIQRGNSPSEKSNSLDANRFPAPPVRQTNGTTVSVAPEIVSTTIVRESNHPLGMSMLHTNEVNPNRSPLHIQYITPGGPIDRDGKLRVGDEVISINGINLKGMRFDDALSLLQSANSETKSTRELHLVVVREPVVPPLRSEVARPPPQAGELPYGDRSLDGVIEEVELKRDPNNSLGLSIVGGIDHCSHPFGVDRPGVFVSKISANSPASRSKKLRVGDRILTVNGRNVAKANHADAVELLKNSGHTLRLGVCHEPQPNGLREVFFTRRPGEAIGLTILGGIRGSPANPNDPHDEGIFIERVEPKSCASEASSLRQGVRILEVNDDSLLGCSKAEAAQILRQTNGRVRLLVCDGFNTADLEGGRDDEIQTEFSLGSSSMNLPFFSTSSSTLPQINPAANNTSDSLRALTFASTTPTVADGLPLGRSSPVQRPVQQSSFRSPPVNPVLSSQSSVTTFSTNKTNEPKPLPPTPTDSKVSFEDMNFTSKIRHFENELTLRSGQPLGNKPKFSNNNNEEDADGSQHKLNNGGSENIPAAVRTIPIKVERNGSSCPQPPQKFSISVADGAERKLPTILNTNHVSNSKLSTELLGNRHQAKDPNSHDIQFVDDDK